MSSGPLSPDVLLGITLSAICSRNRYTKDPGPVIDELRQVAGERLDILAMEAGSWSGFYDDDNTRTLARALLEIPGASDWVKLGQERRHAGRHSTEGFAR